MRRILFWLAAGALLTACATADRAGGAPEDFDAFFHAAQQDRAFRLSRTAPDLRVVEEIDRGTAGVQRREIDCGVEEIEAHGWTLLPAAPTLEETGTAYRPPERLASGDVAVTLGPVEGGDDARYLFRLRNGAWFLTEVIVYSDLEAGAPAPAPPCGAGAAPVGSTPGRLAA